MNPILTALSQKQKYEVYEELGKDVLIDFDGTAAEWQYPKFGQPNKGFRDAVLKLKSMGLRTVLWTSRFDPRTTTPDEANMVATRLKEWLDVHNIPVDEIDLGCLGKRLALAYVDDRGVRFRNWEQAVKEVAEIRAEVDAIREARDNRT